MKTRMELWKEYRSEIEKNVELKEAVIHSNEKLNILYSRLLKVFPEYEEKYKLDETRKEVSLERIDSAPEYDSSEVKKLLDVINNVEEDFGGSLSSIDEINFSSEELDDVIREIKKGKIKSREYIEQEDTSDVHLEKTKQIDLGGRMVKINVAIDGPSGSGKSTAAKLIAKRFGFTYINTGLVYRACALYMVNNSVDTSNKDEVIKRLPEVKIELLEDEVVKLNGEDVTKAVRSDVVSQTASIVAAITEVRAWALKIQQDKAKDKGVVMDGRDVTFKVLPDAELKIFLDTDPEVRAQRRVEQNKRLGFSTNYDEILEEIKIRDHRDRTRATDPLHQTEDAVLIDSSNMDLEQVVSAIDKLVRERA